MDISESVFIIIVSIIIFAVGMALVKIGGSIATTEIIKNQKVCVNASSSGVEFTKCFKLVEVK